MRAASLQLWSNKALSGRKPTAQAINCVSRQFFHILHILTGSMAAAKQVYFKIFTAKTLIQP